MSEPTPVYQVGPLTAPTPPTLQSLQAEIHLTRQACKWLMRQPSNFHKDPFWSEAPAEYRTLLSMLELENELGAESAS